jgi:hypothetical protein
MVIEPRGSQASVTGAIRQAARATGADFRYLLATAQVESNLNPNAKGATSSARGLFQFIEQTWLATLKEEGPALGYRAYADAIGRLPSGEYAVLDPRHHDAVMNLRADPTANAVMAGAYTRSNAAKLAAAIGRRPTEGELYLAHFLGPSGAIRLIGLAASAPRAPAAAEFPAAARANPAVFFDRAGRMRGAADVYRTLVGRYDLARSGRTSPTVARAPTVPAAAIVAPLRAPAKPMVLDADHEQVLRAYAAATEAAAPPAALGDHGPAFHGLFRSPARPSAVAPVVSELWSAPKPKPLPAEPYEAIEGTAAQGRTTAAPPTPLELFQDTLPDARALFRGRV